MFIAEAEARTCVSEDVPYIYLLLRYPLDLEQLEHWNS